MRRARRRSREGEWKVCVKEIETVEECFKDRPLSRLRERIGDDGGRCLWKKGKKRKKREGMLSNAKGIKSEGNKDGQVGERPRRKSKMF